MRGRKPKPTGLKQLEGNPGKRAFNAAEPHPPVPQFPPRTPCHLGVEAKREWKQMCHILLEIGLYTEIDHAALEMYCQSYGDWIVAKRKVRSTGGRVLRSRKGALYTNPWVYEANGAWERLHRAAAEFGMTPSTRSRVRVAIGEKGPSLTEQLFAMVGGAAVKGND